MAIFTKIVLKNSAKIIGPKILRLWVQKVDELFNWLINYAQLQYQATLSSHF